ncbi:protein SOB FIVE-LIKE 5-like isoform X2 [Daucus carota subsp. sativus]|uniref:protein SOB FIVE-LIKE 5-like isoform X2 n=1 Tax=Daucus carota subsp. sativus TaxID=79200 RepID=UPI0007EF825A|nr:PREDICTED: uncharacterized protein LOC108223146 isoform X2 [Daucus carota subsp. sativus]
MNMSASECSSGCESGWTAYLEQSSRPAYDETRKSGKSKKAGLQEDKDLSMVSDASSGPRLDHNNDVEEGDDSFRYNSYYVSASEQGKTRKPVKNSHLDDTASSPVSSSPKKNLALSSNQSSPEKQKQGFSATRYSRKSLVKRHSGFLKSSVSENEVSQASGDLHGTKYKSK